MATTKRQDKIQAKIERLNARKAKFESGAYNKKYEKMFGDDDRDHYRAVFVDDKYDYYEFTKHSTVMKSAHAGSLGLIWTTVS